MRIALDIDFEVSNNEDIALAVEKFKGYLVEAIPTQDEDIFRVKLIADIQSP